MQFLRTEELRRPGKLATKNEQLEDASVFLCDDCRVDMEVPIEQFLY
jgi:hypothetical protein